MAFDRVSADLPIRIRAEILEPDVVTVLDSTLLHVVDVTSGLKDSGILVINTVRSIDEVAAEYGNKWRLALIDATKIAKELLGVNIVNTTILGALLKVTGVVKMDSLIEPLNDRFGRLAERNIEAMKEAFQETIIKE
mgnify:CR=1 FL=1